MRRGRQHPDAGDWGELDFKEAAAGCGVLPTKVSMHGPRLQIRKAVRTDPQRRIYTLVKESTFVLQMSIYRMKISFNRQIKYYSSYAIFSL